MYCRHCGKELDREVKFCPACGGRLGEEQSPAVPKVANQTDHSTNEHPKESVSAMNMVRTRKTLGNIAIIIGLLALICGYMMIGVANSHKPINAQNAYRDNNGNLVVYDTFQIGGNAKAEASANNLKVLFWIAGAFMIAVGIGFRASGSAFERKKTISKWGRVIDLDVLVATLEHEGGARIRYLYRPADLVLVIGDQGVFEMKDDRIVGFKKDI